MDRTRIEKISAVLLRPRTLLVVYVGMALFAAIQLYSFGRHFFTMPKAGTYPNDIMNHLENMNQFVGVQLTEYNNYLIFKYSFFNLCNGINLYSIHHSQHWDFFKYSPTFALLMAPMAVLPDVVGLCIWNVLNAITMYLAIRMLPFTTKAQSLLMWFVAMELLTCLQNTQSNGLMAGLVIAAYGCLRREKLLWATLWLVLATYIKVYGAIGFALFLFYPGKPKAFLYTVVWTVLFAILPLMVTSLHTLGLQYKHWGELLSADAEAATGLSVAGWLHSWFGLDGIKTGVSAAGILLFLVQFVRLDLYKNEVYRLLTVASMLLWVTIFNHKAESPTFIIAVVGVGIWYFTQPVARWRQGVLLFVFLFTCMATTDLFPPPVRKGFIYPYTIKAVPCIVAWCVVFVELLRLKKDARMARPAIENG